MALHDAESLPTAMAPSEVRDIRLVVLGESGAESACTVRWAGWYPTVGDLAGSLGLDPGSLRINGQDYLNDELLDSIDLFDGTEVRDCSIGPSSDSKRRTRAATERGPRLHVDHIAGRSAGARLELPVGPLIAEQTCSTEESSYVRTVDGQPDAPPDATPVQVRLELGGSTGDGADCNRWDDGDVMVLGADLFEIWQGSESERTDPSGSGRSRSHVVHRQPRLLPAQAAPPVPLPTVPSEPPPPSPFSWMLLLVPIPVGVLIAILFRPYFLLFTMMGPMMSVARWAEGRRRFNSSMRAWVAECGVLEARFRSQVERSRVAEVARQRSIRPTIAELAQRAVLANAALWERRSTHEDFMDLCVGYHGVDWRASEAEHVLGAVALELVPLVVTVGPGVGVGIVGDPGAAHALATGLLIQAVTLHGPADLGVEVRGGASMVREWDWCTWLPHLVGQDGPLGVACHLVVEAAGAAGSPRVGRANRGEEDDALARIVVAATVAELPAECSVVITCEGARVDLLDLETREHARGVMPVGCSRRFASRVARAMAPLRDPDVLEGAGYQNGTPASVALVDLIGPIDDDACAHRWRQGDTSTELLATVGSVGEPLTIDLVSDGPHMLVAGMTGSGKSEFLRTLVASLASRYGSTECSFVLVDFKGGGAFDAVGPLPHVASVVTDLDAAIAERALLSLRAELADREEQLRSVGASDFAEYRSAGGDELGRLLLIVDEFATMAADLPDFLTGLVDIAQRGRSLGVHLVLATQRPAGVLDNKIRANTNLRVCLRVHDASESRDVVGVADAAQILSRAVGRAILRIGAEPARSFQGAHIGAGRDRPAVGLLEIAPLVHDHPASGVGSEAHVPNPLLGGLGAEGGLIERLCAAAAHMGLPPADPPWLEPPSPDVDPVAFWRSEWIDPERVPLGRSDIPEQRLQPPWMWEWTQGPLALIGGSAQERYRIVELIASAVDFARVSAQHGARGSAEVARLECFVISPTGGGDHPMVGCDDVEGISRIIDRCSSLAGEGEPDKRAVVVIGDYGQLAAGADPKTRASLLARLDALLADRGGRIAVALMAANERSIPLRVLSFVHQRMILALPDASAYATFGLRSRDLPTLSDMCGVDPSSGHLTQFFTGPSAFDLLSAVEPVVRCPEVVDAHALPVGVVDGSGLTIPIGLDLKSAMPVSLGLAGGAIAVIGNAGAGRTTALVSIAAAVRRACPQARVTALSGAGPGSAGRLSLCGQQSLDDVVLPVKCAESLNQLLSSQLTDALRATEPNPWIILVDDAGHLDPEVGRGLLALVNRSPLVTAVIAGTPDDFRSVRSWCSPVRSSRIGLVLSADRSDGDLLKHAMLSYPGVAWRRGDATLVLGPTAQAVRVATVTFRPGGTEMSVLGQMTQ